MVSVCYVELHTYMRMKYGCKPQADSKALLLSHKNVFRCIYSTEADTCGCNYFASFILEKNCWEMYNGLAGKWGVTVGVYHINEIDYNYIVLALSHSALILCSFRWKTEHSLLVWCWICDMGNLGVLHCGAYGWNFSRE